MAHPALTQARLKELLHYDPGTGVFTWRASRYRGQPRPGAVAGSVGADGYLGIKVEKRRCFSHRLAWLYMTGTWPAKQIDHVNRQKTDNRFCNLREADVSENHQNLGLLKANKTGFPGVSFVRREAKFYASIKVKNKTLNLGLYQSAEMAHAAYVDAKARLHVFHPHAPDVAGARG